VGPRAGLDAHALAGNRTPVVNPIACSLYLLSYRGVHVVQP